MLQLCDCVMLQQVCDGAHWHNVALIGPQRLAVHWEPFGTSIFSRTHPLARVRDAFDAAPKATGWQLVSVTLNLCRATATSAGRGRIGSAAASSPTARTTS